MKAKDWLIGAGAILMLVVGLSLPTSLAQAQGVTVTADAPAQVDVGNDFVVRLNISSVTDFDAAALRVRFAPAILRLDSITDGEMGGTTIPVAASEEKGPGLWGMVANVPGFPGVTGSGYLLELHFHALAVGTSAIGLEHYSMSDKLAQEISATWVDDSVDVIGEPPPAQGGADGPPPPSEIQVMVGGKTITYSIGEQGEVLQTIAVSSADGKLNINIPEGTIALDDGGNPLASLGIVANEAPPPPPPAAGIVGMAYDVGPSGTTFDTPATFTLEYDPAALPEGTAEEGLVLAFYDEAAGEWVEVPSTVDVVANTITASVSHLTTFAIIAGTITPLTTATPAAFSVASLSIEPPEVQPGEAVTISVSVVNTGGAEGSYSVVLEINGVPEAERSVTVAAGGSRDVSFSVTREDPGSYSVAVDGFSGSLTVTPPPAGGEGVPEAPLPATFSVSGLSIEPLEIQPGEAVIVNVSVANTGGREGSYSVVLEINGVPEAEQSVTVAAGSSRDVSFGVTREDLGSYSVAVDGFGGSLTVVPSPEEEEAPVAWSVLLMIMGGAIVAAAAVAVTMTIRWRRRREIGQMPR